MKLVIEKDGVKREIDGPFRLCVSRLDADILIAQLRHEPQTYGWVTIHPEVLNGEPNSPPRKWAE
jgi:hypothetical protein